MLYTLYSQSTVFLIQGQHEDVNRVRTKPTPLPPMDDSLPDQQKAMECWKRYLRTDDSRIVGKFAKTARLSDIFATM